MGVDSRDALPLARLDQLFARQEPLPSGAPDPLVGGIQKERWDVVQVATGEESETVPVESIETGSFGPVIETLMFQTSMQEGLVITDITKSDVVYPLAFVISDEDRESFFARIAPRNSSVLTVEELTAYVSSEGATQSQMLETFFGRLLLTDNKERVLFAKVLVEKVLPTSRENRNIPFRPVLKK